MKQSFETKSGKWECVRRKDDVIIRAKLVHLESAVQNARDLVAEGRAALTEILIAEANE